MRCLLAGAWQVPSTSTFSLPVDASIPSPSPRCRWPRTLTQPASAITGPLWLSYSTLVESSLAAPVLTAAAAAAAAGAEGKRRNLGIACCSTRGGGASNAAAGQQHDPPERDMFDLAALLDVLGLTERDILPEMSKRNQDRLGVGQGRERLTGLGGGAARDR